VTVGPLSALERILAARPSRRALARWLDRPAPRLSNSGTAELLAVLLGDGTLTERA
jgi:hypothetical protein